MTALAGTLRRCSLDCPARYDAAAVLNGGPLASGWRLWPSLGLRLCPDHSWLWADDSGGHGPHRPTLTPEGGVTWVRCACGWELDTAGLTAGESADRYMEHLGAQVAAANARQTPELGQRAEGARNSVHRQEQGLEVRRG